MTEPTQAPPPAPKLLNHGGKREGQGAYRQVEGKGSNKADYITARLKRAGPDSAAIRTPETQTQQLLKVSKVSAATFR